MVCTIFFSGTRNALQIFTPNIVFKQSNFFGLCCYVIKVLVLIIDQEEM